MMTTTKARFLVGMAMAACLMATTARTEDRSPALNALSFIAKLGEVGFTDGGAALLPLSVLKAQTEGSIPPTFKLVLLKQLMAAATTEAIGVGPKDADSYAGSMEKFKQGYCVIQKAFQTGIILSLMPEQGMAPKIAGQGEEDQDKTNLQQALLIAQHFKKSGGCVEDSEGIDPALLNAISQATQ